MTLQAQTDFSIPEETVRVARAAYPKGNLYLTLRDTLGPIYQDQAFAHLFPHNGHPAQAPWRLALITVMCCPRSYRLEIRIRLRFDRFGL